MIRGARQNNLKNIDVTFYKKGTCHIEFTNLELLKRFNILPNDIIVSCRGTIGKLYQLPIDAPLGIIHPSLMKIRIKDNIYHSLYLCSWFCY